MNEIRIQEIDGQEFIPFKDYKRLLERNEEKMIKIRELEGENLKLKEEKQELEYLWDINEELKEENKKLKERIKELEATNKKRTADNWATFKS